MGVIVIAAVLAAIYFFGIRKGKDDAERERAEKEAWKDIKRTSERVAQQESSPVSKTDTANANTASPKQTHTTSSRNAKKSYGPLVDPIIQEGNKALSEMGRLYNSIPDEAVKEKIKEIIRITDKIMQHAIDFQDDVPQIRKFFNYYLPTTIKLLNAYDRMDAQGITGANIDKSKKNIYEMLDVVIAAYEKRLDSLFEDQALDIETDIDVMNQMLEREGLLNKQDFVMKAGTSNE